MRWKSVPAAVLVAAATLFGGVAAHDAAVPVERELTTRALAGAIGGYRRWISPRLRGRIACRFEPTCSAYGLASVEKYGALRGGWRAVKRIARCTPGTPAGTADPP